MFSIGQFSTQRGKLFLQSTKHDTTNHHYASHHYLLRNASALRRVELPKQLAVV
jgi:hypothetical protein